jgi:lactoylglutathione lyase
MASYLHTCYRIGDIDRSVSFYEKLGFEERRRMPIGDEATNVFMGLPGEDPVLELTYNHGVDSYRLQPHRDRGRRSRRNARGAVERRHRAGEAAVPARGPNGGLVHRLRA